ncbi:ABC-type uncharacterized transport system substrate-binding protein [Bradyrhizobium ottawaense]
MEDTLRTLGYEAGRNLIIDFREANGRYADLPKMLGEVIALNPDVIVAEATPAIAAAQKLTSTIPIVMAPSTDPVGLGFVQSFARPGGNITGVANMFDDLTAKMLDIVKLIVPEAKRIGVLSSANPSRPPRVATAIRAAEAIGITAEAFIARNPEDLEKAFADIASARPGRSRRPCMVVRNGTPVRLRTGSGNQSTWEWVTSKSRARSAIASMSSAQAAFGSAPCRPRRSARGQTA